LRFKQEALAPVGPRGAGSLQADASERARFRLLEVDMAWETLRNPAARARYDDELKGLDTHDPRRRPGPDPLGLRDADPRTIDRRPTPGWNADTAVGSRTMSDRSLRGAGARSRGASAVTADPIAVTLLPVGDQSWADDGSAALGVGGRSASIWESRKAAEARSPRGVDVADAAELAPASTAPPEPAPRWVRWAPILIGGVVLSLVLGWGALAARRPEPAINIDTTQQMGVGRCLRYVSDATAGVAVTDATGARFATGVPCDEPHDARIVSRESFPTSCPSGRPVVLSNEKISICVVGP